MLVFSMLLWPEEQHGADKAISWYRHFLLGLVTGGEYTARCTARMTALTVRVRQSTDPPGLLQSAGLPQPEAQPALLQAQPKLGTLSAHSDAEQALCLLTVRRLSRDQQYRCFEVQQHVVPSNRN